MGVYVGVYFICLDTTSRRDTILISESEGGCERGRSLVL